MALLFAASSWEKMYLAALATLYIAFVVISVARALDDPGPSVFFLGLHGGLCLLSALAGYPVTAGIFAGLLIIDLVCWGYDRWLS